MFFLSYRKQSYVEKHSVKPGDVLLDRGPIRITQSVNFKYIYWDEQNKNKHYQVTL